MKKLFRNDILLRGSEIIIKPGSIIFHGLISPLNLRIGNKSVIHFDIICKRNLVIDGAIVYGDVLARGDILISSKTFVKGKVVAGGKIEVTKPLEAEELLADGEIIIAENVQANKIATNSDLIIKCKINVSVLDAGGRIVRDGI